MIPLQMQHTSSKYTFDPVSIQHPLKHMEFSKGSQSSFAAFCKQILISIPDRTALISSVHCVFVTVLTTLLSASCFMCIINQLLHHHFQAYLFLHFLCHKMILSIDRFVAWSFCISKPLVFERTAPETQICALISHPHCQSSQKPNCLIIVLIIFPIF